MKILLATASALALLASATACSPAETDMTRQPDVVAELPDTDTPAVVPAATGANYVLAAGEIEASDLIGASVHDPSGTEIATVADIWLGVNGGAPLFVVRDGGVAGVGGSLRTVAYSAATIVADAETAGDEPDVIVRLTETTLETLPAFEQTTNDDFRLASEMIGTTVDISSSGDSARINDLILTGAGEARYAVISPDMLDAGQIVVEASAIAAAEGDAAGGLVLNLDAQTLAAAPAYPRE